MTHQSFTDARYDSIASFLEAVQLPCRDIDNRDNHQSFMDDSHTKYDKDWYGAKCKSGMDVLKKMSEGWPDGRDRMNALRDQLAAADLIPAMDRRRRLTRGPSGDYLDMGAVYSGRFDIAWRAARRVTSHGSPRVDIVANMIASGYEHSDVLFWRGAAAAVLTDLLEQAGYMVRLVVAFGGAADGNRPKHNLTCSCRVTVKEHGMPLDITSTSAVILPGFFRALGHAWIANHAPYRRMSPGIAVGSGKIDEGEILLSHSVRDHGSAVDRIKAEITKINNRAAA